MELLLINHPLDCPVCDKGGECPLQNQAMSNGRARSRASRTSSAPTPSRSTSPPRCCSTASAACCAPAAPASPTRSPATRSSRCVERGALQQVGIYEEQPFESYFSGNTVQICPVGALTGAAYRFRARPFDLVSTPSVCEHCASGCAIRTDHRRGTVLRRMALNDPAVNEEWNCDKGRWAFAYADARPTGSPSRSVRDEERRAAGRLLARGPRGRGRAAWPPPATPRASACSSAAASAPRTPTPTASSPASCCSTNDIDFRARPHSVEEADFLASHVVATGPDGGAVTYADLERARHGPPRRLRARGRVARSCSCACARRSASTRPPCTPSRRSRPAAWPRSGGTLIPAAPGTEAEVLRGAGRRQPRRQPTRGSLPPPRRWPATVPCCSSASGSPTVPGALSAAAALAAVHRRPPGVGPAPCR